MSHQKAPRRFSSLEIELIATMNEAELDAVFQNCNFAEACITSHTVSSESPQSEGFSEQEDARECKRI